MKNLSLALNGILAIAVIVLYMLHFSAPKVTEVTTPIAQEDLPQLEETVTVDSPQVISMDSLPSSGLPVAYVNIDELNAGYNYIKDMAKKGQKKLEAKKRALDAEKQEAMKEYQVFMENYQAGIYKTQQEIEQRQLYFQQKQQELVKKEYELEASLEKEMAETNEKIMASVSEYLGKYSQELNYSFILATGTASSVLYAADSLNITAPILEGLNAEYASKK